jgi:callose synthase
MLYLFTVFFYSLEAVNKNRKIILVALYFLIWGEAANVRFLPECLCYIFHNVSPFLSRVLVSLLYFQKDCIYK